MKTLEHLREQAYRAHSNVSFSPEKRAESIVNDYVLTGITFIPEYLRLENNQGDKHQLGLWNKHFKIKKDAK